MFFILYPAGYSILKHHNRWKNQPKSKLIHSDFFNQLVPTKLFAGSYCCFRSKLTAIGWEGEPRPIASETTTLTSSLQSLLVVPLNPPELSSFSYALALKSIIELLGVLAQ